MNVRHAAALLKWIERNRQMILTERPTQAQLAQRASESLGFKVSAGSIRDGLEHFGIATKRVSRTASEIGALKEEVARLKTIITKMIAAPELPEWLREELERTDLPNEAKTALRRMQNRSHVNV